MPEMGGVKRKEGGKKRRVEEGRERDGEKREINFYLPGTSFGVSGGPKGGRT